jgi:hypothetical protein
MIAQIFENKHYRLQYLAKHSKSPYERAFRMAKEIMKALDSDQMFHCDISFQDNVVIFREIIVHEGGQMAEIVELNLDTGKYIISHRRQA